LLTHPTHEALNALKLDGMAEAFAELITQDRGRNLDPVAWIGLMLDREQTRRGTRRFQSRLRAAKLRHGDACMEDVDYRTPRGLDRTLFQSLGVNNPRYNGLRRGFAIGFAAVVCGVNISFPIAVLTGVVS